MTVPTLNRRRKDGMHAVEWCKIFMYIYLAMKDVGLYSGGLS